MKNSKRIRMVLLAVVVSVGVFTGCAGKDGESPAPESVVTENTTTESTEVSDKSEWNFADYVSVGTYEEIEIVYDGLSVYVGDVEVFPPYSDETYMTYCTLQYYYKHMNLEPVEEFSSEYQYLEDEEVARLNLPGITTFLELKNHVCSIVNANDGLIELMKVGDAYMDQVVARSDYNEIPEQVIMDCEKIYNDYLSEMRAEYNDFVEFPPMEEPENTVQKVLAAMAIAHENGIDRDGFQYREVLEYALKLNVK